MAHILIVEDDIPLRRILTIRLVRQGHSVAEADSVATAREAIQAVRAPFEVILLDINLPDGTGWDVLRQQGQALGGPHSRVIVMTAVRQTQHRRNEFRPAAILLKPFPRVALLQLIDRELVRPEEVVPFNTATQPELVRLRSLGR